MSRRFAGPTADVGEAMACDEATFQGERPTTGIRAFACYWDRSSEG